MLALIIIMSVLAYVGIGIQTARLLTGHFRYNRYLDAVKEHNRDAIKYPALYRNQRSMPAYEDWYSSYDPSKENAMMLCVFALPVALVMLGFYQFGSGQWTIDPKHVRQSRQIKAKDAYIKELEESLDVGR